MLEPGLVKKYFKSNLLKDLYFQARNIFENEEETVKKLLKKTFAKNLGAKYAKKIINKGISASKKFNQSKYGNMLKNQGSEFGKIAGKKNINKICRSSRRFDWI